MMREEIKHFDQIMVYDKVHQRLISSPAQSPEQGPPSHGDAYEQELNWQHCTNTIEAAKILNFDLDQIENWTNTLNQLKPIEIGESG